MRIRGAVLALAVLTAIASTASTAAAPDAASCRGRLDAAARATGRGGATSTNWSVLLEARGRETRSSWQTATTRSGK
jgi:hypothetical protein